MSGPSIAHLLAAGCLLAAAASVIPNASAQQEQSQPQQQQQQHDQANDENLDPTGYFRENSLHDAYTGRLSFDQYVTHAMRSIALVAGFDNDLHRYDSRQDLIDSFERNLTYGHDLSALRAHVDSSERELLHEASELTLIENERNQATCARQLDLIFEEAVRLFRDYRSYTQSKRLDLIDFFDSFGAAPHEQLLMGNTIWLGGYEQCQRARVELATSPATTVRGRYCVAHLRLPSWSRSPSPDKISLGSESIKLGVCLPRACNSISILRHAARLEALIRLIRLHQVPYSRLALTQLFCLPDEGSPLRQFSPSARAFLGFVSIWLALVAYFSLKYEIQWATTNRSSSSSTTTTITTNTATCAGHSGAPVSKLIQVFALRHAWHELFEAQPVEPPQASAAVPVGRDSQLHENLRLSAHRGARGAESKSRSVIHLSIHSSTGSDSGHASPELQPSSGGGSSSSEDEQQQREPQRLKFESARQSELLKGAARPAGGATQAAGSRPNLAAIDGIKVISMIWLISGHTMLFFIRNITNGRQFWTLLLDGRFLTIMAGIFPVDSFFTVTGVLSSYLKFNKSQGDAMRSPNYWLEIFVHRYLRFMPMYLLVFWYTRDVSEYIGHGPMWDYATASTSLRSICKRESLLVPMLFQANFKPIEQHCVKPAWYLANDYQYLLITPIYMLLLLLSRSLGYLAIGVSVLASLALQFLTVYKPALLAGDAGGQHQEGATAGPAAFSDFEALANFRPMFATYVLKDLWRLYVLPYNRIPPYLIGLLTGHLMYRYNNKRQQAAVAPVGTRAGYAHRPTASSIESLVSASSSIESISSHASSPGDCPLASCGGADSAQLQTQSGSHAQSSVNKMGAKLFISLMRDHVNVNVWTPIALLLAVIYLPMATKVMGQQEGEQAKVVASSIIALMRFVWSLSVARLIYLCYVATTATTTTTDRPGSFVIRLLSSSKWKPFSKIGLSVLLIQWEIIGYVNQVQAGPPLMSITYLLAFVIICTFLSYALGLIVYLVFEYPMSQIEQLYIHPILFSKQKPTASTTSTR